MALAIWEDSGINNLKIFLKHIALNIESFIDQELHRNRGARPPRDWIWGIEKDDRGSIIIKLYYDDRGELKHFLEEVSREYKKEAKEINNEENNDTSQ